MAPRRDVRDAMIARLGSGSMTRAELVAALAEDGRSDSAATVERHVTAVLQRSTSFGEIGDRVVYVPGLVDGTTWSVKVDAADAEHGFMRMHPSLTALGWWLIDEGAQLVDGDGRVMGALSTDGIALDGRDTDVVYGPPGWLEGLTDGWASMHVTGSTVRLDTLSAPPTPNPVQIAAMRAGFAAAAQQREALLFDGERADLTSAFGEGPILGALLADREAFVGAVVPFVPDLLEAAGLTERDGRIADADFDWESFREWQRRRYHEMRYGLDERGLDGLSMLVGAADLYVADGASALGETDEERSGAARLLAAWLEQHDVAEAFLDQIVERGVGYADLGRFADELDERVGHDDMPGLAWLMARCAEACGLRARWIELLGDAASAKRAFRPALVDAAALASDRGEAAAAWAMLQRAGVDGGFTARDDGNGDDEDDDPDEAQKLWRELAPFAMHRPKALAGRNDPCPCGSGRKYKVCHLGRERHDIADRAGWLWEKASRYARSRGADLLYELASDLTDDYRVRRELNRSPFVIDLALHEHGMLTEFIENRGWLLPDDEALLAAQWVLVERSVYEIAKIGSDRMDLRDVATGDELSVVNINRSNATSVGSILVGRPLPVGDAYRAFPGFIPLAPHIVNPVIDAIASGDPDAVVDAIAVMLRRPQIRNTSGEVMVSHRLRWSIEESSALDDALARGGFERDGQGGWTLVADTSGLKQAVVATMRFEKAENVLVAETNSDERASRVRELVESVLPSARLVDDRRRSLTNTVDDDDLDDDDDDDDDDDANARGAHARRGLLSPDEVDPEIREQIDQLLITKEREWIDESIPALGGRTPREAVRDPVGREQVRQLLASWPEPPAGVVVGFRASRIRALLDLVE